MLPSETQHRKKTIPQNKEPVKKEPPKPTIPTEQVQEFLEGKLSLSTGARVTNIEAGYLWNQEGIEKYRINVWCEKRGDSDSLCVQVFIGGSYFVHYNRKDGTITDRTL